MRSETLDDLADSLGRERVVKGMIFTGLLLALVIYTPNPPSYLRIIFFALLADLFALNRLRRLVHTLQTTESDLTIGDNEEGPA